MKRTPLKRTAMKRKPARSGRVPDEVRQAVMLRNGGRCEVGFPGVCTGRAEEFHHRQSRSASRNPHTVGNGCAACHACHDHLTHHSPQAGRDVGAVVSRHYMGDPAHMPMKVPGRGWVYLTPAGGYEKAVGVKE